MTLAEIIEKWEESTDSKEALNILRIIEPSFVERYEQIKSLSFVQKSEINKKLRSYSDSTKIIAQPKSPKPQIQNKSEVTFLPEEIQFYKNKVKYLHKLQSNKHALLSSVETVEERYILANAIITEIIPSISSCYQKIRNYEENGIIPDFEKSNIVQWVNELHAKRKSNIEKASRLRSKKKKVSANESEVIDQQLMMLQYEIKSIDEKLNL